MDDIQPLDEATAATETDLTDGSTEERGANGQDRHRVEFTADQNREIARIVAREVAAARRKAEAAAAADKERQEAEARGEYQKVLATLEQERDALRQRLREQSARQEVERAARKANADHPEVVYRMVRDDLAFSDDGNATNADALVAQFKKDYPRYFAAMAAGADGGTKNPPPSDDMNAIIRKAAGRG